MIVPRLTLDATLLETAESREQLLSEIRHASLFGSACLVSTDVLSEDQLAALGRVVKQSSGFVNLQLQLMGLDDAPALELLNIGASHIVTEADERQQFESIPDDRILIHGNSVDGAGQGDQVFVETPSIDQLVDLEKQGIDVCVDSVWLDLNPETIVDYYCGVTQDPPGFCHRNTHTCFGEERSIATVVQRLKERIDSPDAKSFTRKLANDAEMLQKKLLEEAGELAEANQGDDRYEVAWEAADVMYFSLVAMLNNGVGLDEVYAELARRMNRIVRRKNKLES